MISNIFLKHYYLYTFNLLCVDCRSKYIRPSKIVYTGVRERGGRKRGRKEGRKETSPWFWKKNACLS